MGMDTFDYLNGYGAISSDALDVMKNSGYALMGIGEGSGENRVMEAVTNAISNNLIENATIDGANYIQKLRYVILPLCSKTIMIAILIRSMDVLRYVDKISIITKGGPADATKIAGWHLYEVAFRFQDFGKAAVLAILMLTVTIVLGKFFIRVLNREN